MFSPNLVLLILLENSVIRIKTKQAQEPAANCLALARKHLTILLNFLKQQQ